MSRIEEQNSRTTFYCATGSRKIKLFLCIRHIVTKNKTKIYTRQWIRITYRINKTNSFFVYHAIPVLCFINCSVELVLKFNLRKRINRFPVTFFFVVQKKINKKNLTQTLYANCIVHVRTTTSLSKYIIICATKSKCWLRRKSACIFLPRAILLKM